MVNFLELQNLSKTFGGVKALSNVDFDLAKGEIHSLVGGNGSGKSTMIKIISGVQSPDYGSRLIIEGKEYSHLTTVESSNLGIQVIYQDLSLFPNLTVAENIAIGQHRGKLHTISWSKIRQTALAAIKNINADLDLDELVIELPIAKRQLVAICRAIAADAKLLIMDEPTASLTRHEVDALLALTVELKNRGISIVFVSHRFDEVLEIADRVTVVRDGVKLGTYDAKDMTENQLVYLMSGKEFHYETAERAIDRAKPILKVNELSRSHEYDDINLSLYKGEILGITGLLGSGRTELALSLFGMNKPDKGTIEIEGKAVRFSSNTQAIHNGIAYVPEDRLNLSLNLDQPISTNIVVTVLNAIKSKFGIIKKSTCNDIARQWISDLKIKVADPELAVQTLSGGNQQRVVIAKWLATNPKILILDSPTVGVDFHGKDGIYNVIKNLASSGLSVILISDEISEVLYHSDRILVMHDGKITAEYLSHQTSEAELKEAVYV
ncbi:sugar ABC transporter ATP-binding protein [Bartonella sp. HY761]|uniref:sugar ABC transporter ATP-binding protein n=1 Tax=Bartonella sp. HY761 TaxID=2979330 RepID=UPI002209CC3D|nr:sugar ABC transporter ATP-binding protein [Bartonella sp. HY761]UXN06498.1 sugar ABC transporter ATP-binding protein [Bartonella sp. HY761]